MELKIEGTSELLKELHIFIYQKDKTLELNEEYQHSPGVHKEAVVTALTVIGTAIPLVRTFIKEYFKYKIAKIQAENDVARVVAERELMRLKISIRKDGNWQTLSNDELTES